MIRTHSSRLQRYVALKIPISDSGSRRCELSVLKKLQTTSRLHGSQHVGHLLDHFEHAKPNGSHTCLVLELLGPSVPIVIEHHFATGRLPGALARKVSMQAALGLNYLHTNGVGHGDLHTGNIAFTVPSLDSLPEVTLMEQLGPPRTSPVVRSDGGVLTTGVPRYLVWPTSIRAGVPTEGNDVKIIDFGESFQLDDKLESLHTPLALRAPEVLFGDCWDHRVDLWSLGCTVRNTGARYQYLI